MVKELMHINWMWNYVFDNRPSNLKAWMTHYRWRVRFIVADVLYALAWKFERWADINRDMTDFRFRQAHGMWLSGPDRKGSKMPQVNKIG